MSSLALVALAPAFAADTSGSTDRLAVAVAARRLTLGRYNVLLGAEPGVAHSGDGTVPTVVLPLRVGLSDDVELFAAPVARSVDPVFREPGMGVVWRLTDGPVEVGISPVADLGLIGPPEIRRATLELGVPVRIHALDAVAVDVGAYALQAVHPDAATGLLAPVGVTANLADALFVGATSGVRVTDLAADEVGVPLSATVGGTVSRDGRPLLDVGARVRWDDAVASDAFDAVVFGRLLLYP